MINKDKDYIISGKTQEVFAILECIEPMEEYGAFAYRAFVVQESFPDKLKELAQEYQDSVNGYAFSLLSDIEVQIADFELRLKEGNTKIFGLEIFPQHVEFFIKYPTADGYKDDYPF